MSMLPFGHSIDTILLCIGSMFACFVLEVWLKHGCVGFAVIFRLISADAKPRVPGAQWHWEFIYSFTPDVLLDCEPH